MLFVLKDNTNDYSNTEWKWHNLVTINIKENTDIGNWQIYCILMPKVKINEEFKQAIDKWNNYFKGSWVSDVISQYLQIAERLRR